MVFNTAVKLVPLLLHSGPRGRGRGDGDGRAEHCTSWWGAKGATAGWGWNITSLRIFSDAGFVHYAQVTMLWNVILHTVITHTLHAVCKT